MISRAAGALLSIIVLASCSSGHSPKATDSTRSPTATTAVPASAPSAPPGSVTITTTDYAFEAPARIPAGVVNVRLVNHGKELHQVQLLRLEQGKTIDDVVAEAKAGGPPPKWAVWLGGPNGADPGSETNAMQVLAPGRYALLCLIPSPDHIAHVAKGMVAALEVTGPAGPAMSEPADIVATISDYGFKFSTPLRSGSHVIRVENAGPQLHELVLIKLNAGKSVQDFAAWAESMQGPPPAHAMGGIAVLEPGKWGQFSVKLEPGEYGLLCFVPDSKDGKPHLMHGMTKQIRVG